MVRQGFIPSTSGIPVSGGHPVIGKTAEPVFFRRSTWDRLSPRGARGAVGKSENFANNQSGESAAKWALVQQSPNWTNTLARMGTASGAVRAQDNRVTSRTNFPTAPLRDYQLALHPRRGIFAAGCGASGDKTKKGQGR